MRILNKANGSRRTINVTREGVTPENGGSLWIGKDAPTTLEGYGIERELGQTGLYIHSKESYTVWFYFYDETAGEEGWETYTVIDVEDEDYNLGINIPWRDSSETKLVKALYIQTAVDGHKIRIMAQNGPIMIDGTPEDDDLTANVLFSLAGDQVSEIASNDAVVEDPNEEGTVSEEDIRTIVSDIFANTREDIYYISENGDDSKAKVGDPSAPFGNVHTAIEKYIDTFEETTNGIQYQSDKNKAVFYFLPGDHWVSSIQATGATYYLSSGARLHKTYWDLSNVEVEINEQGECFIKTNARHSDTVFFGGTGSIPYVSMSTPRPETYDRFWKMDGGAEGLYGYGIQEDYTKTVLKEGNKLKLYISKETPGSSSPLNSSWGAVYADKGLSNRQLHNYAYDEYNSDTADFTIASAEFHSENENFWDGEDTWKTKYKVTFKEEVHENFKTATTPIIWDFDWPIWTINANEYTESQNTKNWNPFQNIGNGFRDRLTVQFLKTLKTLPKEATTSVSGNKLTFSGISLEYVTKVLGVIKGTILLKTPGGSNSVAFSNVVKVYEENGNVVAEADDTIYSGADYAQTGHTTYNKSTTTETQTIQLISPEDLQRLGAQSPAFEFDNASANNHKHSRLAIDLNVCGEGAIFTYQNIDSYGKKTHKRGAYGRASVLGFYGKRNNNSSFQIDELDLKCPTPFIINLALTDKVDEQGDTNYGGGDTDQYYTMKNDMLSFNIKRLKFKGLSKAFDAWGADHGAATDKIFNIKQTNFHVNIKIEELSLFNSQGLVTLDSQNFMYYEEPDVVVQNTRMRNKVFIQVDTLDWGNIDNQFYCYDEYKELESSLIYAKGNGNIVDFKINNARLKNNIYNYVYSLPPRILKATDLSHSRITIDGTFFYGGNGISVADCENTEINLKGTYYGKEENNYKFIETFGSLENSEVSFDGEIEDKNTTEDIIKVNSEGGILRLNGNINHVISTVYHEAPHIIFFRKQGPPKWLNSDISLAVLPKDWYDENDNLKEYYPRWFRYSMEAPMKGYLTPDIEPDSFARARVNEIIANGRNSYPNSYYKNYSIASRAVIDETQFFEPISTPEFTGDYLAFDPNTAAGMGSWNQLHMPPETGGPAPDDQLANWSWSKYWHEHNYMTYWRTVNPDGQFFIDYEAAKTYDIGGPWLDEDGQQTAKENHGAAQANQIQHFGITLREMIEQDDPPMYIPPVAFSTNALQGGPLYLSTRSYYHWNGSTNYILNPNTHTTSEITKLKQRHPIFQQKLDNGELLAKDMTVWNIGDKIPGANILNDPTDWVTITNIEIATKPLLTITGEKSENIAEQQRSLNFNNLSVVDGYVITTDGPYFNEFGGGQYWEGYKYEFIGKYTSGTLGIPRKPDSANVLTINGDTEVVIDRLKILSTADEAVSGSSTDPKIYVNDTFLTNSSVNAGVEVIGGTQRIGENIK